MMIQAEVLHLEPGDCAAAENLSRRARMRRMTRKGCAGCGAPSVARITHDVA